MPTRLQSLSETRPEQRFDIYVDINIDYPMSTLVPFETTMEVRDRCLCLHAQRAARALARRFDAALRPAGLTNGQFSLLMSLNRRVAPSMGPIARLLAMDRTTLTAALKPLERRDLVELQVDPADQRSKRLVLTTAGRKALADAVPIWRATHQKVEADLLDPSTLRRELIALA